MLEELNSPYIIGETAFHHEGDFSFQKELVKAIAGRDEISAVKCHLLLDLDDYMIKDHQAYQILNDWMFSESQWEDIINDIQKRNKHVILYVMM